MEHPDLVEITLETAILGETKRLTITNLYNPSPRRAISRDGPSTFPQLNRELQDQECQDVVVGDFNLHHPKWGGMEIFAPEKICERLFEAMEDYKLVMVTEQGVPTRRAMVRQGTNGRQISESVLDLTLISDSLTGIVGECSVAKYLGQDSDHFPILTTLRLKAEIYTPPPRYQFKKVDRETFQHAMDALFSSTLPELFSKADIDNYVTTIHRKLEEVMKESVPLARHSSKSKSWWTKDCSEAIEKCKEIKEYLYNGDTDNPQRDGVLEAALKSATKDKDKVISKSKSVAYRSFLTTLANDARGMWKIQKWAKLVSHAPQQTPKFPEIWVLNTAGEVIRKVNSLEGKAQAFHDQFFAPPPPTDLSDLGDDPESYRPQAEELHITSWFEEQDVEKLIMKLKPGKAPGPSKIPNDILRLAMTRKKAAKDQPTEPTRFCKHVTHLLNACIELGYQPKEFKKSATCILPKPGKNNHYIKSYRPIALLDTLGKAFETVYAQKLSALAETNGLLPDMQMGGRPGRDCGMALEMVTEQVHKVWQCGPGYAASILSLDMAGAYDNASHPRLLQILRSKGIPKWLVDVVQSFLKDRTSTIRIDDYTSQELPVTNGIPQGSPLSPILFLFYNYELIEKCNRRAQGMAVGFVDDVNIVVWGKTTEGNCRVLEHIHKDCADWAKRHGAVFNPTKYQLIHLSTATKRHNMSASIKINEVETSPTPQIKVLGLYIDSKLTWAPHTMRVKKKLTTCMYALSKTTTSTYGMNFRKARQVYKACISSVITYGSQVWYDPTSTIKSAAKTVGKLQVEQNKAIRMVTGAFRATPVAVLHKEAYIPPLKNTLDFLQVSIRSKQGMPPEGCRSEYYVSHKNRIIREQRKA